MRGEQLSRQWRILRVIESRAHGITVAELAAQEDCSPRTIWRDLAAIQAAGFPPGPWNKSLSNLHKRRSHSYASHSTYQAGRLIVPLVLYSEKDGQKNSFLFMSLASFLSQTVKNFEPCFLLLANTASPCGWRPP